MAKYQLTNKALADLNRIWEYTLENWSENQADRYYEMLIDICEYIAENPEVGKNYNGIIPQLFGYKANQHVIFYRKSRGKSIEVTRILHQRMDLKRRISE